MHERARSSGAKTALTLAAPSPYRWSDNGGGFDIPFLGFILFIVGMVVIVLGTCKFATYAGRKIGLAQQGMRRVCEETSALHPRMSFHVREERGDALLGLPREVRGRGGLSP